mgnify:CR=1 FL=1
MMDFQVLMRSSDRRLLIESCIKFYAKELNIDVKLEGFKKAYNL